MTYLEMQEPALLELGALNTAREIACQPDLWNSSAKKFFTEQTRLDEFLDKAIAESTQVILTGAGTSAFVGISLEGTFFQQTGKISRAVSTTNIVSHPENYFSKSETPLVISFARSGNSPESAAALELADGLSKKCFHFIVTCNAEGELARYDSENPVCVFVLPEQADDKSLAMTGSYTSMLLTGLLMACRKEKAFAQTQVVLLTAAAKEFFRNYTSRFRAIAEKPFQRAVFLGSGPQAGTAIESALKLQELTDGRIICVADSYLGFRHGPKAVIDEETLVLYFLSPVPYVARYEKDLVDAMKTGNSALFEFGIGVAKASGVPVDAETLELLPEAGQLREDFLPVCTIIAGQLLGFFKSLQLGLMPDAPSISGSISRVVQGVNIYPID